MKTYIHSGKEPRGRLVESVLAHTPGPWQHSGPTTHPDYRFRVDHCQNAGQGLPCLVALVPDQANARLIAAAPDLLAAARQLVDCCEVASRLYGDKIPATAGIVTAWKMAKDAIAKAKGGAS